MAESHKSGEIADVTGEIFGLFFNLTLVFGLISITIAVVHFATSWPVEASIIWSAFLALGINLISASALSYFLEKIAHNARINTQQQLNIIIADHLGSIAKSSMEASAKKIAEDTKQTKLAILSHLSKAEADRIEMMRMQYAERIARDVFEKGVHGAFSAWASKITPKFLDSQDDLSILLKDGKTFFSDRNNIAILKRRLLTGRKT